MKISSEKYPQSVSTELEYKICNKITKDGFPFERFKRISELLIRRQSRRWKRIKQNKLLPCDISQGFKVKDFPKI